MKEITIIGGGVAGLSLGIGLRARNVPVRVFEAGTYPRHKVCGEFISGRGQDILNRLELTGLLQRAGARHARTGMVFLGRRATPTRSFPRPALCISRYILDELLASEFVAGGGAIFAKNRCQVEPGEGIVWATGRTVHKPKKGWKWFGLKAHAEAVQLDADLEMHAVENGYVGLCNLGGGGMVNVCGLFRRRSEGSGPARSWKEELTGGERSVLRDRLRGARWDESSLCAVAGLGFAPEAKSRRCAIGDAFSMIPPATGNGMSLALESAWLAIEPLAAYAGGKLCWVAAEGEVMRLCEKTFSGRLTWGRVLHSLMMSSPVRSWAGPALLKSNALWRVLFQKTRDLSF